MKYDFEEVLRFKDQQIQSIQKAYDDNRNEL